MSQHIMINVKLLKEKYLVEALEKMGFKPSVHKTAVPIKVWQGAENSNAHIVIPRTQGFSYGDVGFEKTEDGYIIHIDSMDQHKLDVDVLNKTYAECSIMDEIRENTQCYLSGREVEEDGSIIIRVGFLD